MTSTRTHTGQTVRIAVDCDLRRIARGDVATVVETFAPQPGRNVELADGRVVNVHAAELVEAASLGDLIERIFTEGVARFGSVDAFTAALQAYNAAG